MQGIYLEGEGSLDQTDSPILYVEERFKVHTDAVHPSFVTLLRVCFLTENGVLYAIVVYRDHEAPVVVL